MSQIFVSEMKDNIKMYMCVIVMLKISAFQSYAKNVKAGKVIMFSATFNAGMIQFYSAVRTNNNDGHFFSKNHFTRFKLFLFPFVTHSVSLIKERLWYCHRIFFQSNITQFWRSYLYRNVTVYHYTLTARSE